MDYPAWVQYCNKYKLYFNRSHYPALVTTDAEISINDLYVDLGLDKTNVAPHASSSEIGQSSTKISLLPESTSLPKATTPDIVFLLQ